MSGFYVAGRDRNKPCPCDSGKKWKKCHPNLDSGFVPPVLHKDDSPGKLESFVQGYINKKLMPKLSTEEELNRFLNSIPVQDSLKNEHVGN